MLLLRVHDKIVILEKRITFKNILTLELFLLLQRLGSSFRGEVETPEKKQWANQYFERFAISLQQSGQSVPAVFDQLRGAPTGWPAQAFRAGVEILVKFWAFFCGLIAPSGGLWATRRQQPTTNQQIRNVCSFCGGSAGPADPEFR